uniref:uncharacterized protein LOC120328379 n=1 Tax=Styela clava TaxID=7725 RepID=UPI001939CED0|nr:uncharacterized protein LOC120328379 [Styela clava]XP_039250781.1 uncharacterized protein LOC120328379 [Styela clava]
MMCVCVGVTISFCDQILAGKKFWDAWFRRMKKWGRKLTGRRQHNPVEERHGNEEGHYQPQQQSYYSSRRRRRSSRVKRIRWDSKIAEQENEEESESTNNLPDYNENKSQQSLL